MEKRGDLSKESTPDYAKAIDRSSPRLIDKVAHIHKDLKKPEPKKGD